MAVVVARVEVEGFVAFVEPADRYPADRASVRVELEDIGKGARIDEAVKSLKM